jgi:uncharacterized protein (UPF0332 family)
MDWAIQLAKARANLHTAPHAYAQGDVDSCVSRAYVAVLHGEIAALVKRPPFRQERWGHDRVQAECNRRLRHDQTRLSAALRLMHNDLIGRRHMTDATAPQGSARAAARCLRNATALVSTIATVLAQP